MPIYEYECRSCGETVELIHPASANRRPRCEDCGAVMKKLISPSAFILKGSGWYVTDYPSKSRKEGMEAEKKASGSGNGPSTGGGKSQKAKKKPSAKVEA